MMIWNQISWMLFKEKNFNHFWKTITLKVIGIHQQTQGVKEIQLLGVEF